MPVPNDDAASGGIARIVVKSLRLPAELVTKSRTGAEERSMDVATKSIIDWMYQVAFVFIPYL